MATTTETADTTQDAASSGKKKLIILVAAGLGLLAAAGGGAFFLMGASEQADAGSGATAQAPDPYFYALDPITVNLNSQSAEPEYLELTISLEMGSEDALEVIEPRMPRVIDAFQVYLRELRRSDLEGSAGIYRLKEELLRRVNIAVHPAVVNDILFQEMLVQ